MENSIKHLKKNKASSTGTISKLNEKGTNFMSAAIAYMKTSGKC